MTYVTCVNNKTLASDEVAHTYAPELIIGQVYKVAPPEPNDGPQRLRVIDGSGEDYLYPASYFEPLIPTNHDADDAITVHLPRHVKGMLHAEAIASHKSMSALLREWIDERLDLPQAI
jgi:hypothetical protein